MIQNLIQEFKSQFKLPSLEIQQQRGYQMIDLLENEKIVQLPVRTKQCRNHIQWSFDLLDIYYISAYQEVKCPICYVNFTQSDIILDNYWYSFNRQFNQYCQYIVILKDMCYQKVYRQHKYTRQLENNQDLIYQLYERRDEKYNFSQIIKQDELIDKQLNEFKYSAVCLQDHVKLYIPVRFRDCRHIGAYELSSLLCLFNQAFEQENKPGKDQKSDKLYQNEQLQFNKFYQCRQAGCNVRINYDILISNLVLDYELLQAIKLSHPSAINFQIRNYQGKIQFEDEFTNEKDQFIKNLWVKLPKETQNLYPSPPSDKIKLPNCYKEFFTDILELFQRISSNQNEEKVIKAILLPFRYQTYQIPLFDTIANMIIEYPARCIECKDMSKCLDLRTFISIILNQRKQEREQFGIICPLCQFNHMPKKRRHSIQIQQTLYLDNQLLAYMIRDNSYMKLQNNILFYDGKKLLLEEFKRHQIMTIDQAKEFSKNNRGVMEYSQIKCCGTNTLLKDPLVLLKCPNKSLFNIDYIYEELQKSKFKSNELNLCKCENCYMQNKNIQDLQDVYYDEFLANIISQLPQNYQFGEASYQFYTFQNFRTEILSMIILGSEQLTQQIENQQKLLNKYDSISKKDQFKKWNLNISNIKYRSNFPQIEW